MNGATKNEILGFLKDSGMSAVLRNRLENLLENAFDGDIAKFANASHGELMKAYKETTESKVSLSKGTFQAHDEFAKAYRRSLSDARALAKETVKAQEAKEAEKAAMRQEILEREIDFEVLTSAMAALGTLKITKSSLGRLLDMYDLAAKAVGK